jgi:hypothetical protein
MVRGGLLISIGLHVALGCAAAPASALLVLGVHSGVLHVQEIWMGGVPYYALYNSGLDSIAVDVRELSAVPPATQPVSGSLAVRMHASSFAPVDTVARWNIGPRGLSVVRAPLAPGGRYFEFLVDGWAVGKYCCTDVLDLEGRSGALSLHAVLDTPCGWLDGASMELGTLWSEGGSEFEVEYVLRSGAGVLQVRRCAVGARLRPITVTDVRCETLPVLADSLAFRVDSRAAGSRGELHRVRLTCLAPSVSRPELMEIEAVLHTDPGWAAEPVHRGILVRPAGWGDPPAN